ncbi:MAG: hypothetical protein KF760_09955 [Candidatus Eremiobacteraeota bacterium]|nr:hypothetical protein [Candidatus Eremiobacteraeota bacterium]MCW5868919.1 hypothetical protein [Candidatus Eremiobacteraeota bacterium]
MSALSFQKVSDVSTTYPYLCVYSTNSDRCFLQIEMADNQDISFVLMPGSDLTRLSHAQWIQLLDRAEEHRQQSIENEEACEQFLEEAEAD